MFSAIFIFDSRKNKLLSILSYRLFSYKSDFYQLSLNKNLYGDSSVTDIKVDSYARLLLPKHLLGFF